MSVKSVKRKQSIFTVTAKAIGKHFKRRAKYFEPKNVGSLKNLFIFCHVDEDGVFKRIKDKKSKIS